MDLAKHCIVKPGGKLRLKHRDPGDTFGKKRDDKGHAKTLGRLRELQHLLYADRRYSLLIILQALDAGGKDGTIRHVMSGVNPQGCEVVSFKAPSHEDLSHDFLWRIHGAVPSRGNIGIFNRSHYEDVLVVRVHDLVPKDVWLKRYRQINEFERMLTDNGVTILKFFLHISKAEQKRRFEARMQDTSRNWTLAARFRGTAALGQLHRCIPRGFAQVQHRLGALVCNSLRSQVVPQSAGGRPGGAYLGPDAIKVSRSIGRYLQSST